jgi:hypothetical protein
MAEIAMAADCEADEKEISLIFFEEKSWKY